MPVIPLVTQTTNGAIFELDSTQSSEELKPAVVQRSCFQKLWVALTMFILMILCALTAGPFVTATLPSAIYCLRDLHSNLSDFVVESDLNAETNKDNKDFLDATGFVMFDEKISLIDHTIVWSKPILGIASGFISNKVNPQFLFGPGIFVLGLTYFIVPVLLTLDYRLVIAVGFLQGLISGAVLPLTIILLYRSAPVGMLCSVVGIAFSMMHLAENLPQRIFTGFCSVDHWPNGFYSIGTLVVLLLASWSAILLCSKLCSSHGRISGSIPVLDLEQFSKISSYSSSYPMNETDAKNRGANVFKHTARTTSLVDLFVSYDFYTICLAGFVSFGAAYFCTNYLSKLMISNSGISGADAEWSTKWFIVIGACFSTVAGPFADWTIRRGSVGISFKLLYSLATLVPATCLLAIVFMPQGLSLTSLLALGSLSMALLLFYPVTVVATSLLWFPEHVNVVAGVVCSCMNAGALVLVYFVQWIAHEHQEMGDLQVSEAWIWRRITGAAVGFIWVAWSFYLLLDGKNKNV